MTEEPGEEDGLIARIVGEAVKNVFDQYLKPKQFRNVVEFFESGKTLTVGDGVTTADYLKAIGQVRGFRQDVELLAGELEPDLAKGPYKDALHASVAELILDGLHVHNRLNKQKKPGVASYGM